MPATGTTSTRTPSKTESTKPPKAPIPKGSEKRVLDEEKTPVAIIRYDGGNKYNVTLNKHGHQIKAYQIEGSVAQLWKEVQKARVKDAKGRKFNE